MAKIKFYANRVILGKMTIDEVPEEYREAVIEYIENM